MLKKVAALAVAFTVGSAITAGAATLGGYFTVEAVNVTNLTSTESRATEDNFLAAKDKAMGGTSTFGGADSVAVFDKFRYNGLLDFRIGRPQNADYMVSEWLDTGTGSVLGLNTDPGELGTLQLSRSSISTGTAETTFFLFTLKNAGAGDLTIVHDDGVAVFDDGTEIGFTRGPTGETTTIVDGFDGGTLQILYVATNGNPSILEVDTTAVPLPAGLPLLAGALGFLGWRARSRKTV